MTVQTQDSARLQASLTQEQPRYERGRSKLEQKAERKDKKRVFRGSVKPLLVVHDF